MNFPDNSENKAVNGPANGPLGSGYSPTIPPPPGAPSFAPVVPPLPYEASASLQPAAYAPASGGQAAPPAAKPAKKGIMGALAALGALLAKFWSVILAVLLKFKFILLGSKFLLTGGTLFLSILVYSFSFGWPLAAGFVGTIFVHECGHAWAAKKLGHKVGWMVFIPFMGGLVFTGRARNAVEDAFVGIMGPVFGTAATLAWLGLFYATHNFLFLALASLGCFLNLINLAPTAPLDGGWIVPIFSPRLLIFGIPFLLIFWRNPMVWLLCFMSIPRIMAGWKKNTDPSYFQATSRQRALFAAGYLGLMVVLASGYALTASQMRNRPRRPHMDTHTRQVAQK